MNQTSLNNEDLYGGIFNISADEVKAEEIEVKSESDPDFYRPSVDHKKAKERTYEALIRFVPNVHQRGLNEIKKYQYYLIDPDNPQIKFYVDCTSNEGKMYNIVSNAFFMLKDHDSAVISQMAKRNFKRLEYFWRLVLIMNDEQEKELEGKIKIMRYAKKVHEKMEQELTEDLAKGKRKCIFIDPIEGKNFNLIIKEVNDDKSNNKISSYDGSYFIGDRTPIVINGRPISKTEEDMMMVYNYFKENSPNLAKVAYESWSEEEHDKIIRSVRATIDNDTLFNKVYRKTYNKDFIVVNTDFPTAATVTPEAAINNLAEKVGATSSPIQQSAPVNMAETPTKPSVPIKDDGTIDYDNIKINFDDIED
jgi:hypothetical protein